MKFYAFAAMLMLCSAPASAQLSAQAIAVVDAARQPRTTFSTNERVTFQQRVSNASVSTSKIQFTFFVQDPGLATVFSHSGNAVPGQIGNAASQIGGVPVSSFFSTPGVYKLTARATLDAQVVSQEVSFTVSSPNILLIYPPNGARGVADKPLTLRWSSSGAAKYRVTVGDNPSFFNSVFTQVTDTAVNSFSYPDNPPDQRARLAAGTVYYWKIEGLDVSGNAVAASQVPFNFTVESAALTRDVAVTGLDVLGQSGDDITFRVTVKNQGGTSENNLSLKFSVGGLPASGSPVIMPVLSAGTAKEYNFTMKQPTDQGKSLAIGCVEFFDDNVANNCKTLQIERQAESDGGENSIFDARQLSNEELWSAIRELLKDRGMDLSDYSIVGADQQLTRADLEALLAALRVGQAEVTVTGPDEDSSLPDFIPPPVSGSGTFPGDAPPPVADSYAGDSESSEGAGGAAEQPAADPEMDKQWAGLGPAFSENASNFSITSNKLWKRTWKRLGGKEAPKINFRKYMIVGVIAGSAQRADRVEIVEIKKRLSGLHVEYQVIVHRRMIAPMGAEQAKTRNLVPYHLRVIPKTGLTIKFEEVRGN